MVICITDVLGDETLSSIRAAIESLRFEAGAGTAGWHAREVKRSLQAVPSPALRQVQRSIADALMHNEVVRNAALPAQIAPPLLSRYGVGDSYGTHVDDALMGNPPIRSDMSLTLFLTPASAYEGGELIVMTPAGEEGVKLEAGSAVLYPSTALHRVAPVTSGERLAAVTWIQSLVRDPGAREILFDLETVKRALFESEGKSAAFDRLAKVHANLLRRWAVP